MTSFICRHCWSSRKGQRWDVDICYIKNRSQKEAVLECVRVPEGYEGDGFLFVLKYIVTEIH